MAEAVSRTTPGPTKVGRHDTSQPLGERLAFDQFQHQRANTVGFFQAVDGRNVRMIRRGEHLGFALEARHAVGTVRETVGQNLQRDVSIELLTQGPGPYTTAVIAMTTNEEGG